MCVAVFQCVAYSLFYRIADGRCDTGKEENVHTGKQGFPVKLVGISFGQGASGAVVEDACRTDIASLFKVINTKSRTAAQNAGGIDPVTAQFIECGIAYRIFGSLLTNAASSPRVASDTATLDSAPP